MVYTYELSKIAWQEGRKANCSFAFRFAILLLISLLCLSSSATVVGQENLSSSLESGVSERWWNADNGTYAYPPASLLPNGQGLDSDRDAMTKAALPPASVTTTSSWDGFWNALGALFSSSTFWLILLTLIIIAIIVGIILTRAGKDLGITIRKGQQAGQRLQVEAIKLKELSFDVAETDTGLLETAKKLAAGGDFSKAIIYLFSHLLVDLDEARLISIRKGKTNRMYLRELKSYGDIMDLASNVVFIFERTFFGRHAVTSEEFQNTLKICATVAARAKQASLSRNASASTDVTPVSKIASSHLTIPVWLLVMLTIVCGCKQQLPIDQYGGTSAVQRHSVSSFTALRGLFDEADHRTIETNFLSSRLDKCDVIVWTPDSPVLPAADANAWIDNWLKSKPNAVLVYIGRDYAPAVDYWQGAIDQAKVQERSIYATQKARAMVEHDAVIYGNMPASESYGRWFVQVPHMGAFQSHTLTAIDPSVSMPTPVHAKLRSTLVPISSYTNTKLRNLFPNDLKEQTEAEIEAQIQMSDDGDFEDFDDFDDGEEYLYNPENAETADDPAPEEWTFDDLVNEARQMGDDWDKKSGELQDALERIALNHQSGMTTEPLVIDENGAPFVFTVTNSEYSSSSRVLVIQNASLCANYALGNPDIRQLMKGIIGTLPPESRVAFLNPSQPMVFHQPPPTTDMFGLKLFMTYPISFILIHLIFLGFVALLAYWPIFGRAQTPKHNNERDFGRHVEAFGALLRRSGDRSFAQRLIARYFREIRGEPNSVWAADMSRASNVQAGIPSTPQRKRSGLPPAINAKAESALGPPEDLGR